MAPATSESEYRLPRTVVPLHYELTLAPDLRAFTFQGTETVTVEVHEATTEIVCNAAELEIQRAILRSGDVTLEATVDPTTYTFAPWACERASGRANATSPQRLNQLHQREKRNSAKQSDNEFASTGWAPMAQWPIPRTRTRQRSRYPFARPSSRPRQIEVQHHASTPIAFHANGTRKESISNGSEIWRLGIGPERFKKAWLHERRGVFRDLCAPIYQAGEH